jgi:hypothetical protein
VLPYAQTDGLRELGRTDGQIYYWHSQHSTRVGERETKKKKYNFLVLSRERDIFYLYLSFRFVVFFADLTFTVGIGKAICRHIRKEPPKDFCFFFFLFCYYFLGNNKGPGRAAGAGYVLFWSQMSLYLDGIYRLICEERAANLSINKPQHCRRPIFSLLVSLPRDPLADSCERHRSVETRFNRRRVRA